jgi:LuxR family transcriptional regulator, maltose regulon positive regulatory protein
MATALHTRETVLELVRSHALGPLDVVRSKLQIPAPRSGNVPRTALVNRLRASRGSRIITVVAPAGYGKTTALAQWAARDSRPFAWVSVDERDADSRVLLRHLAASLHAIEPLAESVLEALSGPSGSVWGAAVPRLTAVLESRSPCVIVLDDITLLEAKESADVVIALAGSLAPGSSIVLSGRTEPRRLLARLRASGDLLEIGTGLLALSRREAELLVRATDLEISEGQVGDLFDRSEGWPAGLYLGALALGTEGGASFGGEDRYLADYFRSVCHDTIDPARLEFLRRVSVLEELSGPLCDAVLDRTGSALELRKLETENLFVFGLDRQGVAYRCHTLFRELLRLELEQSDPGLAVELRRRAADWFEETGAPDQAIDHAAAAGDLGRVARLVASLVPRASASATASWLEHFAESELHRYPGIAAIGAWAHASLGRVARAERCLAISESADDGPVSARPLEALVRAMLCRDGVERMLHDVETARAELPDTSPWLPAAVFLHGVGSLLNGDGERADVALADAAERAEALSIDEIAVAALTHRALIAGARHDHVAAESFALEGRALDAGESRGAVAGLEWAVAARALLRQSRFDEAKLALAAVRGLEPLLTHATPWLTVETRLELARASMTLCDLPAAASSLDEAARILRLRPELGILGDQVAKVRAELEALRKRGQRAQPTLTRAELRLLPLLATHLSFREIGERLFVSHHTIKTQAISVYRKLGVSSRSQAIEAAGRLGLIGAPGDGAPG